MKSLVQYEQMHDSYKNCDTSNMKCFKGLAHMDTRKINWCLAYLDHNKEE